MTKKSEPAAPAGPSDFRASRIYAQGWNAARTGTANKGAQGNPYATEQDRARWNLGFTQAQAGN